MDKQPDDLQSKSEPPGNVPRLSVLHLLVGTGLVGLYYAMSEAVFGLGKAADADAGWVAFLLVVSASLRGLSLAGPLLVVTRRLRKSAFPSTPGEWLLTCQGIGVLLTIGAWATLDWAVPNRSRVSDAGGLLWVLLPACIGIVKALMYLIVMPFVTPSRWRLPFACAAAIALVRAAGFPMADVLRLFPVAVVLTLALLDRKNHQIRPWTHAMGVTLHVATDLSQITWLIINVLKR